MIINETVSHLGGLNFSLSSISKRISDPSSGKILKDLIQDNKCDRDNLSSMESAFQKEPLPSSMQIRTDRLHYQPQLGSDLRELTIFPRTQKIIQEKDTAADGVLSVDEMGISEEGFAKLDVNEDGMIDQSELESDLREVTEALRAQGVMQDKDTDGDAELSVDEMGISEEAFAKLDVNEDDMIDQSELESGLREVTEALRAQRVLQDKDTDGDGVLSVDEMGISEEAFAKLDVNEDDMIDQSELESGLREVTEALRAQRVMQDIVGAEKDSEMSQTVREVPPADNKLQSLKSAIISPYLRVDSMTQNSENSSNLSALRNRVNFII